jgi:deazaflavin-dependent oxidoreductase (nitroreductase family)
VTGQPRVVELWFAVHEGRVYVLAGGRDTAAWVRNVSAEPRVRLRVAGEWYTATARAVEGEPIEPVVRELLAAKYQGWSPGRPLSRWASGSLPVEITPVAIAG